MSAPIHQPENERLFIMRKRLSFPIILILFWFSHTNSMAATPAKEWTDLWLGYRLVSNQSLLQEYRNDLKVLVVSSHSGTMKLAETELRRGLRLLLGQEVSEGTDFKAANSLVIGARGALPQSILAEVQQELNAAGQEGYVVKTRTTPRGRAVLIVANHDIGVLRGAFHFLRLLQMHQPIRALAIVSQPRIQYRLLNHWDNLDRSVERGYAGKSLWKWEELPGTIDPRYHDYARANASLGINGVVLNNVNANPQILKPEYLQKVAALADLFRPYGIRVFLSANFSAPIPGRFEQEGNRKGGIGELPTSDPLNPAVRDWWGKKVGEIYRFIPDFGGFLVKANSEGMPGPQDYGRSHAEGANMLAEALVPHGGIVMWRAFVYNADVDPDRTKRAAMEFVPLDGQFRPNVFVQAKNGPLDFQPREPVQPLFGAMPKTPMMLELQITQEYLGHSTHLVYLAPMWREIFDFDLHTKGRGSTLASVVDGTLQGYTMTGIAGVANTGDDVNWTGHFFAQANWYAFGRLAWDHTLSSEQIADEWISMTWGNNPVVQSTVLSMMMGSWEACINYMTPLGLHHIMQEHVHYGPGPEVEGAGREDWNSVYYHRADSTGLGYNRSSTGSNAVGQYDSPIRELFDAEETCPEEYLLWFHHVSWDHRLQSGRILWDELCHRYYAGTKYVRSMYDQWLGLESLVDQEAFEHVRSRLGQHIVDAEIWRDTCLKYFQQFSKKPVMIPE
jgi:alpha-glucuronidase